MCLFVQNRFLTEHNTTFISEVNQNVLISYKLFKMNQISSLSLVIYLSDFVFINDEVLVLAGRFTREENIHSVQIITMLCYESNVAP